jgi:hypothetical protein
MRVQRFVAESLQMTLHIRALDRWSSTLQAANECGISPRQFQQRPFI